MTARNPSTRTLDLHLLTTLQVLLEVRSVTEAARRLGVSQPAISQSLRRLREMFDDPLLVRGGDGMVLTPRAQTLVQPLSRCMRELQELVQNARSFEPASSSREFAVSATDFIQLLFLPGLMGIILREAPGIDLRVHTISAQQYGSMLESGELDVMIGSVLIQDFPALKRRRLGREPFACAVREDHPSIRERLSYEDYLAATHILVSPTRSPSLGIVDERLAEQGHRRRVSVRVPSFLIAPHIVAASDHVLTAPRRVIDSVREALHLRMFPPPIELQPLPIWMLWHERQHNDPAQQWLREALVRAYQQGSGADASIQADEEA